MTHKNCIKRHLELQKPAFINWEMPVLRWTACLKTTRIFAPFNWKNASLCPSPLTGPWCHAVIFPVPGFLSQPHSPHPAPCGLLAPPIHVSPPPGALQLSQIIAYGKEMMRIQGQAKVPGSSPTSWREVCSAAIYFAPAT